MALHADAVAENGSAGDTGWSDRRQNHPTVWPRLRRAAVKLIDERALARARRARNAQHDRLARVREQFSQYKASARVAILDRGCGAGEGAGIAAANALRQSGHQLFRSCRAMTSRWISLVPSPIVQSFTSR